MKKKSFLTYITGNNFPRFIFRIVLFCLLLIYTCPLIMAQEKKEKKEQDTAVIDLGKTRILICKNPSDTIPCDDDDDDDDDGPNDVQLFLMDLGINGYLHKNTLGMPEGYKNMSINLARSRYFDIQFITQGINFYNKQLYLLLGIGMSFNNYVFDENIVLVKNDTALLSEIKTSPKFSKSKLATAFWHLPVAFHIRSRHVKDKKPFIFEAGINIDYLWGAHTKIVYEVSDNRQVEKYDDNWHIEKLRYGPFVRIGYGGLRFIFNYYKVPVFKKDEGPQVTPFSIGISLNGF